MHISDPAVILAASFAFGLVGSALESFEAPWAQKLGRVLRGAGVDLPMIFGKR